MRALRAATGGDAEAVVMDPVVREYARWSHVASMASAVHVGLGHIVALHCRSSVL
jgi:hypothetical protein